MALPALTTSEQDLPDCQPLSAGQVVALAGFERACTDGRGVPVDVDAVEREMHEFMWVALGSCSRREPRDL